MAWYLLTDTDGKKSVSFTMVVWTFVVCTLWLSLSIFNKIHHMEIREFDSGAASIWFAPIAGLYFGRRWKTKDDLVKTTVTTKGKGSVKVETTDSAPTE